MLRSNRPVQNNPLFQPLLLPNLNETKRLIKKNASISVHDKAIEKIAMTLESQGYTDIKADHIAWPNGRPDKIGRHIPDITARKNGKLIIEVETLDSCCDDHTLEQIDDFKKDSPTIVYIAYGMNESPFLAGEKVTELDERIKSMGGLRKVPIKTIRV